MSDSGHIISKRLHELGPVIMCTGKCTMYFDVNVHVDASAVSVHDNPFVGALIEQSRSSLNGW